jgi:methyl-accepting chemotaxis protein
MKMLSNMKIGKRLAVVLGGIVMLSASLSLLTLWGISSSEHTSTLLVQRLTQARLAEDIDLDTTVIFVDSAKMLIAKKTSEELLNEIADRRKTRMAAMERFKALANTPTGIKQGAELTELLEIVKTTCNVVLESEKRGRWADAFSGLNPYILANVNMRAKAQEAAKFQIEKAEVAEKDQKQKANTVWLLTICGSFFAVSGTIVGGILLTRSIATPLGVVVGHLGEIANGDLSKDAPAAFLARADEIGMLARAKQTMIVNLRAMVKEITSGVDVLSSSSTELMTSSSQMTAGSRHASDKAHSVSAAAEQMSSNITSVAAGMEETTTNLANVASATDQMTSTIGEIAENSEKARRITGEATRQAARITEQINELGKAAREIGKVTETITEISSQTNLLALNATIEAARAGSAGKGFAVVATEIKALAQQTAAATEDIKARIAGVQAATSGGITEIEKVSNVIQEVSEIVSSIAAAIEEQSAATKDIARNIAEASLGVTDANTRVADSSHVSREIAKDITDVDHAAGDMATGSDHVRVSATELSTVAEQLKQSVAHFRIAA